MELIIPAVLALVGQGVELFKLWKRINTDATVTHDEVAAEVERIMRWREDTDAAEWGALKKKLSETDG